MTLKQLGNLATRQAKNFVSKHLTLSRVKEMKLSPGLRRQVFLESNDVRILEEFRHHFLLQVCEGNKRVLNFLNFAANEANNKNTESRFRAILAFEDLAKRGNKEVIPVLLKGLSDSNPHIKHSSTEGLKALARKGNSDAKTILDKHFKGQNWDEFL